VSEPRLSARAIPGRIAGKINSLQGRFRSQVLVSMKDESFLCSTGQIQLAATIFMAGADGRLGILRAFGSLPCEIGCPSGASPRAFRCPDAVSLSPHAFSALAFSHRTRLYFFPDPISSSRRRQMPEAKGMWEGLMDFSFRSYATPRMLKFLYGLHLLVGLVAAVAWVVLAFQQAPVQGLLAILGALVAYFFWILYCRVILEVLAAVFRMTEAIAPERGDSQHP
jgi:Domain of unknown function (DUF4282)